MSVEANDERLCCKNCDCVLPRQVDSRATYLALVGPFILERMMGETESERRHRELLERRARELPGRPDALGPFGKFVSGEPPDWLKNRRYPTDLTSPGPDQQAGTA